MRQAIFVVPILFLASSMAFAFSPSCMLGMKCVKSQGTSISSKKVLEMMDRCTEFTNSGYGKQVLQMSIQDIIQHSGGNPGHPLYSAYYAFTELYDSPLAFERKSRVENTNYEQIAKSCRQLSVDFENWIKQ